MYTGIQVNNYTGKHFAHGVLATKDGDESK